MTKQTEAWKVRQDLTPAELERLEKYGSIEFKSHRRPDMKVEKFIPSREQH